MSLGVSERKVEKIQVSLLLPYRPIDCAVFYFRQYIFTVYYLVMDASASSKKISEVVVAVIPVFNEAGNIEMVLDKLSEYGILKCIVSIDPFNSDAIEKILTQRGVPFVVAPQSGYDSAVYFASCSVEQYYPGAMYILFTDAGNKYSYSVLTDFFQSISGGADIVLGNRLNAHEFLHWRQRVGTQLVLFTINIIFRKKIHDLGPIRMMRISLLKRLAVRPRGFRFPTETLVKSLALKATIVEVPIQLTPRLGVSKISGNLYRSIWAGIDMFSALQFIFYTDTLY